MESSGAFASQTLKAVSALVKHEALASAAAGPKAAPTPKKKDSSSKDKKSKGKNKDKGATLFRGDDNDGGDASVAGEGQKRVYVVLNFLKMSEQVTPKPIRLPIPHPFRDPSDEGLRVCFISRDPQRQYKDLIKPLKIACISKISGVDKIRKKFKPYEARRNLCAAFDLFLADASVVPILPKLLGRVFFDKKKQPVAIKINASDPQDVAQELQDAIRATYFFQTSASSSSVCIGTVAQPAAELSANLEAVVKLLGKKLPGGLGNIRSVHVKTADSAALPIYVRAVSEEAAPQQ